MIFNYKPIIMYSPGEFDGIGGESDLNNLSGQDFNVVMVETINDYYNISEVINTTAYFIMDIKKIIVNDVSYGFNESDITPELLQTLLSGSSTTTATISFAEYNNTLRASVNVNLANRSTNGTLTFTEVSEQPHIATVVDASIDGTTDALKDYLDSQLYTDEYSIGDIIRGRAGDTVLGWGDIPSNGSRVVETITSSGFVDWDAYKSYVVANYTASNYTKSQEIRGFNDTDLTIVYYIAVVDASDYTYAEATGTTTTNDNIIKVASDGLYVDKADIQTLIDASTGLTFSTEGTVKSYIDDEVTALEGSISGLSDDIQAIETDITSNEILTATYLLETSTGSEFGKIIKSGFLPSYVDDVIIGYFNSADSLFYEEPTFVTNIPAETGKIYIDKDTDVSYRAASEGGTLFDISNPNLANLVYNLDDNTGDHSFDLVSDNLYIAAINGQPIIGSSSEINLSICQWSVVT